ncbi:Prolyl tripeptidyl peptidase [Dyella sp. AD56]|nr:Prolyl tripeptidyl peptidase [Dyella sp. AD56]
MARCRGVILFAWLSAASAVLHAQPPLHVVQPSDIVALAQVSKAQPSPDGSQIAYEVNTDAGSTIWLVGSDGAQAARSLVSGEGSPNSPAWSPDGASLAFLSRAPVAAATAADSPQAGSNGSAAATSGQQIWLASPASGKLEPLTRLPLRISGFRWSHDGRRIAFLSKGGDVPQPSPEHDEHVLDRPQPNSRLWIYDVGTRQAHPLTQPDMHIVAFDWSPDDAHLVASSSPTSRTNDVENVLSVVTIDASSGAIERRIPGGLSRRKVLWSPDGHRLAYFRLAPTTDVGFLVMYDLRTATEQVVADTKQATFEDMEWGNDGDALFGLSLQGTRYSIARINAASGQTVSSQPLQGAVEKIAISHDGRTFAYVQETSSHPGEIYVARYGRERQLTVTNPQVKTWLLGTQREIRWTARSDGRTISAVLLLPPHYDPRKRYKTVVHLHGGPTSGWDQGFHGSWYDWGVILASHGYVVLLPNPRGSDGAGTAFGMANDRDWGHAEFQDIMDGVDQVVADGIADPERMGVGGWSYGGYLTAWVATHTNRFKAAVAGAAMTDLFGMATTTDIAPDFLNRYFGPLAANAANYDAHSPARYLRDCQTPVLVVGGEDDARVPFSQGMAMYRGLRFLGKETQMVLYPREPHFFGEPAHQRDSLERMLAWYDAHLGP